MTDSPNGRGLLTPQELAEAGPAEAVRIQIDLIDPNPQNPRQSLVEIDALAENIKRFGLLQPVTVRRAGERYELLGGHRRLAAFALLKEQEPFDVQWRTIPAVVRTADDDTSYLMLISGQVHNRAWRPREEAAALERLVLSGMTLLEIGQSVSRTEGWASRRLRVYADSVLSGYVQTGRLSTAVAEELLVLRDPTTRQEFAERAVAEQWSLSQARAAVKAFRFSKELPDLARRVQQVLDLLEPLAPELIPLSVARNLITLHSMIERKSGQQPRFPSIEAARRAAGVTPRKLEREEKATAQRQRAARAKRRRA